MRVQLEAEESKLLLFETFWFTIFLSRTSYRGARAPKNINLNHIELLKNHLKLFFFVQLKHLKSAITAR